MFQRSSRCLLPAPPGRPGCCPTTTRRGTGAATAARRRGPELPPYAGEELGLEDAHIPPERRVDPGGRDGCRAPIPWTAEGGHGWPVEPWLPFAPEPAIRSVAAQREDPTSVLHLYRRLLTARHASAALRVGSWTDLPAPEGVLVYERTAGNDRRTVLVNFSEVPVDMPLDAPMSVEVSSTSTGEGIRWTGALGPSAAVVLNPGVGR